MNESAHAAGTYDVQVRPSRAGDNPRVLKHGDTFALFDRSGDIARDALSEEGIYHRDTRHLSRLALTFNGNAPMLLSGAGMEDGALRTDVFTNQALTQPDGKTVPFGSLHITRHRLLWNSACYERISATNLSGLPVAALLRVELAADFADIFEVRGVSRAERGLQHPVELMADGLRWRYDGRDGRIRTTLVRAAPAPSAVDELGIEFLVTVEPGETRPVELACSFEDGPLAASFDSAVDALAADRAARDAEYCRIVTSHPQFNEWIERSLLDMQLLVTQTEHGLYPYAGVPWFATVYGRDGIIAALQMLWVNPEIARGVLRVLAAYQGDGFDPERGEEPGKIVHELRNGELATLGVVPFGRYYGSADATPLFVMLAGAYLQATGDLGLAAELWPHVERALEWIERYGDLDGDGFVEYSTTAERGLTNQGWKDSWDSVFHSDGSTAAGPIALVEVQAYVFAAYVAAAHLARVLGHDERADQLGRASEQLRTRFDSAFWSDKLQTYALALDGEQRRCEVRASNAGHALFAGIALPERVPQVAAQLLSPAWFSGWGIRTVARGAARYNPLSYHNGSIWPHDTALIAHGLARYGYGDAALTVFDGLFQGSLMLDLRRLPELFCGFERQPGHGPVLYPTACAPQAWASGAAFMLLSACLGMTVDALAGELRFRSPRLPAYLSEVELRDLRVGAARVDVRLRHEGDAVGVAVLRGAGDVRVVVAMEDPHP